MKTHKIFCIFSFVILIPNFMYSEYSTLHYLYKSRFGTLMRPIVTSRWINKLIGIYFSGRISKRHIRSFVKRHQINMGEAQEANIKKYKSFNDFFTRKLRTDARQIDNDPRAIISPTDGQLSVINNINSHTTFIVKDTPFNLEQFLQNKEWANYFNDGIMAIIYLAPWNYHRFHFPINCIPEKNRRITGRYESVNSIVYNTGVQPLLKNERQLWILKTESTDCVALIPVGALCVGKICQTFKANRSHKKGDEAGFFSFGGSTIVLLFKKNFCTIDGAILEKIKANQPIEIRMGERIATRI